MTTTLQHTTDQIQKFTTYTIDKLPSWMHLDPHIKSGYRPHLNSFRRCIASLFYLHNEFVNVWSHLVPGTLYAILLYKNRQALFGVEYCGDSRMGTLMVNLYIFTCTLCLLFSVSHFFPPPPQSLVFSSPIPKPVLVYPFALLSYSKTLERGIVLS